jgi:hypothetical protein
MRSKRRRLWKIKLNYEETYSLMWNFGLFAAPLNNGDWMVGKANCIYRLDVGSDHYEDDRLVIAPKLPEAVTKWVKKNN